MHGVTQLVTLPAKINQVEETRGAPQRRFRRGRVLRRSDFGLSRYAPLVGDEVAVHITLEAHEE